MFEIEVVVIVLLSIAILLFVLSFFRKDRTAELEKQLENKSILYMQEFYQLKKKVRLLEEELLISRESSPFSTQTKSTSHQQLLNEIITYHNHGDDVEDIAAKTGLMTSEVERILLPYLQTKAEGEMI